METKETLDTALKLIGAELGASVKNVIAIAVGVINGLRL